MLTVVCMIYTCSNVKSFHVSELKNIACKAYQFKFMEELYIFMGSSYSLGNGCDKVRPC